MISSKFIIDILDLILDDEKEAKLLRNQIGFLTVTEIEHTGIGLFINFENELKKECFKVDKNLTFDGVEIKNEELNILADAILHVKDGIIYQLEIFNKNGSDYPKDEIETYTLTQNWNGSKNRTISKKAVI
ncbi:hypothetical protein [Flavobacterium aquicola]|uniref:Uncharacterized protein n=1 Tax=Flavobacterium aquicola TaxID=1682742 RepID=A0A3E0EKW8_9FLAO|nr:hypothetical protein [Flavobacterium aquicola]REG97959.1 hypothetical protein C8P67_108124 [Flavobacterium aquicola]